MVSVILQAMPLLLLSIHMHFTEIDCQGFTIGGKPNWNVEKKGCHNSGICSEHVQHVCGKDTFNSEKKTFKNLCYMQRASCHKGGENRITKECDGTCEVCSPDACFHDGSEVMTLGGPKTLRDVITGEEVLTVSDSGWLRYEPVIVDLHRDPHLHTWFYKIQTQINKIMVTPKHFLYIGNTAESSQLVKAEDVRVGDLLIVNNNSSLCSEIVTHIEMTYERGISDPLVSSGKILVNNILAAVYADDFAPLKPKHLHSLIWLNRILSSMKIDIVDVIEQKSGMPYWTAYGEQMLMKFIPLITKN